MSSAASSTTPKTARAFKSPAEWQENSDQCVLKLVTVGINAFLIFEGVDSEGSPWSWACSFQCETSMRRFVEETIKNDRESTEERLHLRIPASSGYTSVPGAIWIQEGIVKEWETLRSEAYFVKIEEVKRFREGLNMEMKYPPSFVLSHEEGRHFDSLVWAEEKIRIAFPSAVRIPKEEKTSCPIL